MNNQDMDETFAAEVKAYFERLKQVQLPEMPPEPPAPEEDTDEENTPEYIWRTVLRSIPGGITTFGTDPCSNPTSTVPALRRIMLPKYESLVAPDPGIVFGDGLVEPWLDRGVAWVNHPYSRGQPMKWVKRCYEYGKAVVLCKADPATKVWQEFHWPLSARVVFLKKRVAHEKPGQEGRKTVAKWPSALVFYGIVPGNNILEIGEVVRRRAP